MARTRLLNILQEIRLENEESDLTTRKLVRETIEDLLTKVEESINFCNIENATKQREDAAIIVADTISSLIDQVEEISFNSTSSLKSDDLNPGDKVVPIPDPPQWEYSSSDDGLDTGSNESKGT